MAIFSNEQNQNLSTTDMLRVLFKLKDITMQSTHVCEIGQVVKNTDNIYQVKILSTGKIIECRCAKEVTAQTDDIAIVLFADKDFRQNVDKILSGGQSEPDESKTFHSLAFGIIIGTI